MSKKFRTHVQGESLQKKIDADLETYWGIWAFFTAFLILAATFWYFYLTNSPITFVACTLYSIVALVIFIFGFRKSRKLLRHIRNCRKGMEGERLVGEILNKLGSDSTRVFHDICGENFNVDHLIISTKGIFTIETKHYDRSRGFKFLFQDGKVFFNGRRCMTLLNQMDGEASFIQEKLEELCGRQYPVRKVAVIIGAFIENPQSDFSKYWILNENSFPKFFENTKETLSIEEVRSIASQVTEWLKVSVD